MKIIQLIIITVLASTLSVQATDNGETSDTTSSVTSETLPKIENLTSFTIRPINGVNYLNWTVKGINEDCVYIVERSIDGKFYEIIDFMEGYKSPKHLTLLFSWREENKNFTGEVTYRIQQANFKDPLRYSDPVKVCSGNSIAAYK